MVLTYKLRSVSQGEVPLPPVLCWLQTEDAQMLDYHGQPSRLAGWSNRLHPDMRVVQEEEAKQAILFEQDINGQHKHVLQCDGQAYYRLPQAWHRMTEGDNTVVLVVRQQGEGGFQRLLSGSRYGSTKYLLGFSNASSIFFYHNMQFKSVSVSLVPYQMHIIMAIRRQNEQMIIVDGDMIVSNNHAEDILTINELTLAAHANGANGFTGWIGEVILYGRALAQAEQVWLWHELQRKWAVGD